MLKPAFIDLSHHNVIPESLIPAREAGIVGVIHKLTEGTSYVDETVDNRYFLAQQAGLLFGLYHFIRPGSIEAQAQHFLDAAAHLNVADDNTLWCLDWEDPDVSLDDAVLFMQYIEGEVERSPVLYSGHVVKEAMSGPDPRINCYRLWLAQYTSGEPDLPPGWDHYWGWQYTDQGDCPGINSPVDLNAYLGTAKQLRDDWSGSGEPVPVPDQLVVNVFLDAPPGITFNVTVNERSNHAIGVRQTTQGHARRSSR